MSDKIDDPSMPRDAHTMRLEYHGVEYDIYRDDDESDAEYAERIMEILEEMQAEVTLALDEVRSIYLELP